MSGENPGDRKTVTVAGVTVHNVSPDQEKVLRARAAVVSKWCKEHNKKQEDLSIAEIMEIRALPEWINAGE
jgi:hypothetical protein